MTRDLDRSSAPFHPHTLTQSFVQGPCWVGVRSADLFPTRPVVHCRLFVLGIGFFSLCFLMTSLGGQLSTRRPGDSPFTIRTEGILLGKGESEMGAGVCGLGRRRPLNLASSRDFLGLCPRDPGHLIYGCVRGKGLWLAPHDLARCFGFGASCDHQASSGEDSQARKGPLS